MTIRDALLPALRERFPNRPYVEGFPPGPIATFPEAHPAVGDLQIFDEGNEAMIFVGIHTHTHFNPHDLMIDDSVTDMVLNFLEDLFADRILIWSIPERSGGCQVLSEKPPNVPTEAGKFVWSGPFTR